MAEVMMAPRHNGPNRYNPAIARPTGTTTLAVVTLASGTDGNFHSSTAPRSGNRSPKNTIATMITMNGNPWRAP